MRPRRCTFRGMSGDPTETDPDKYKIIFENDRVRVLEYRDRPGDRTSPHRHPDSVMYTLSSFERRLMHGDQQRDVQLEAGRVVWIGAQEHAGENIGSTQSHSVFVELKEPSPGSTDRAAGLGPSTGA
jgi:beta-alanine degradation protein BauB